MRFWQENYIKFVGCVGLKKYYFFQMMSGYAI